MKLYLLRHGETAWNNAHRFQGQIDIPLNDFGRQLAEITRNNAPEVKYDRVFCSPLIRACETAEIFLRGRFPLEEIQKDNRLKEISFGAHEGTDIEVAGKDPAHPLYQCLWHPENYIPTDGAESFQQLVDRIRDFLQDKILPLETTCENVLVVAHGAVCRAFVCAAEFKEIKDFWGKQYLNCCLTTLDVTNGNITLEKEAEVFYDPATLKHQGWSK